MNRQDIDKAAALYMDLQLLRRQLRTCTEQDTKDAIIASWIRKNIPEASYMY